MRDTLLPLLRCPRTGLPLRLDAPAPDGEELLEGTLVVDGAPVRWPVLRGIPRFVSADNYADSFGFQWNHFPGTQLDSVSGLRVSSDRFLAQWSLERSWFAGRRLLDVGCGAGRFAEIALELGAEVVAVDLSGAVDACRTNLLRHPRLHVVQASVYELPFAPGTFDGVYSFGVIQHTPDVRATFHALVSMVRPGGELAIDVYKRDWKSWLHPKPWLRPVTARLPVGTLFNAIERAAPALLTVSHAVGQVPLVGRALRRAVPVADYEGVLPLDPRQRLEWAVLDTFDWLSPRNDHPQSAATMRAWADEAGLVDVRVHHPAHLTLRARQASPASGQ
jgi:2-polyprenyl-3-methyl-5-hydroxy-6-metoxy-1,4-benzoquinol methylase